MLGVGVAGAKKKRSTSHEIWGWVRCSLRSLPVLSSLPSKIIIYMSKLPLSKPAMSGNSKLSMLPLQKDSRRIQLPLPGGKDQEYLQRSDAENG